MSKAVYTHAPVGRAAVMRQQCPPFRTDIRLTPSGRASRNASSDYDRARPCGKENDEGELQKKAPRVAFFAFGFSYTRFPFIYPFLLFSTIFRTLSL